MSQTSPKGHVAAPSSPQFSFVCRTLSPQNSFLHWSLHPSLLCGVHVPLGQSCCEKQASPFLLPPPHSPPSSHSSASEGSRMPSPQNPSDSHDFVSSLHVPNGQS